MKRNTNKTIIIATLAVLGIAIITVKAITCNSGSFTIGPNVQTPTCGSSGGNNCTQIVVSPSYQIFTNYSTCTGYISAGGGGGNELITFTTTKYQCSGAWSFPQYQCQLNNVLSTHTSTNYTAQYLIFHSCICGG